MLKKLILFPFFIFTVSIVFAQKNCSPYLDQDGAECVLTWNSTTGMSELFFYDSSTEQFGTSPYQLIAKPTGDEGVFQFSPYLDQDGAECILAWNETSGKSKLYFYDSATKAFKEAPYQLPENPTGDKGKFYFVPYLDQDGAECVLVTNILTGSSKLYFYDTATTGFKLSPYQLPAKPTGDEGNYYCVPYLDMDGVECVLAYNSKTGKSVLYFYDSTTKNFSKSPYQLELKPTGDVGEYHFRPYLDQDGVECVLAYNSVTTKSVLFYYSADSKSFLEAPYQLPNAPTDDMGSVHFAPYIDQDGAECVLVWNSTTGSSKLYFYNSTTEKFETAPYQLAKLK